MKALYIECSMGAAGDMLMSALYELLDENRKAEFLNCMNQLKEFGLRLEAEQAKSCAICGTKIRVSVHGEEETQGSEGHHNHRHEQCGHHHSTLSDIQHRISHFPVSSRVKADALKVYELIAEAESKAHGCKVEEVHFHEVGALDAVADITGSCLLFEMLAAEKVYASNVRTGYGYVSCAHGKLPVPAPATAFLLQGIPSYSGDLEGEFCTPTGAALLKYFVSEFGERPVMKVSKIGYGIGTKQCKTANCIRAFIGDIEETAGQICELVCNLDDITPEALAFASEELMAAGALDVYTTPIIMKKGRPAFMLTCMCEADMRDKMLGLIFRHTTTLGVREYTCRRYKLNRKSDVITTPFGSSRVKTVSGFGAQRQKLEYEDVAQLAREKGMTLEEVKKEFSTGN